MVKADSDPGKSRHPSAGTDCIALIYYQLKRGFPSVLNIDHEAIFRPVVGVTPVPPVFTLTNGLVASFKKISACRVCNVKQKWHNMCIFVWLCIKCMVCVRLSFRSLCHSIWYWY